MKNLALLLMLLVVATGVLTGCSKNPGNGVPATQEEIDNDTAIGDDVPGGV